MLIYMNKSLFKRSLKNGLSTVIAYLHVYVCTMIKIEWEHPSHSVALFVLYRITITV